MKGKPGFRIRFDIERPPQELLAKLSGMSTPNISDAMARTGAMDHRIKPLNKDYRIMGPAVTVKVKPGDNLMLHKATDVLTGRYPGHCYTNAVELMCLAAIEKGYGPCC